MNKGRSDATFCGIWSAFVRIPLSDRNWILHCLAVCGLSLTAIKTNCSTGPIWFQAHSNRADIVPPWGNTAQISTCETVMFYYVATTFSVTLTTVCKYRQKLKPPCFFFLSWQNIMCHVLLLDKHLKKCEVGFLCNTWAKRLSEGSPWQPPHYLQAIPGSIPCSSDLSLELQCFGCSSGFLWNKPKCFATLPGEREAWFI